MLDGANSESLALKMGREIVVVVLLTYCAPPSRLWHATAAVEVVRSYAAGEKVVAVAEAAVELP